MYASLRVVIVIVDVVSCLAGWGLRGLEEGMVVVVALLVSGDKCLACDNV